MKTFVAMVITLLTSTLSTFSQTGISIGPPRVYFTIGPGQSQTERILVTNPSTDYTLELGVSLDDWEYNEQGDNVIHPAGTLPTSCANWITVRDAFFAIGPGETKELEIQMTVPRRAEDAESIKTGPSVPVRTAMLYVTQLNPRDDVDEDGATIRISVRSGIKLYQRAPGVVPAAIDITNFRLDESQTGRPKLILHYANVGKIWADGVISVDLLNQETGQTIRIPDLRYYSMPGDLRSQAITLPENLPHGTYLATAIVDYGNSRSIQLAELEFKW